MSIRTLAWSAAAAALVTAAAAGAALARNPNCSGGILYVTQAIRDRDKGDSEGYTRQMNKAVERLEQCAREDPGDAEALGYLGWAYAELDSAGAAGRAFANAIAALTAKGDKKKAQWATDNRNHFWARAFNEGIEHMRVAQQAYPDFTKAPDDEAETTLKEEASRHYQLALASFTRASLLKPGDAQSIRNLGTVHAAMHEFQEAEAIFLEGLKEAPGDTTLQEAVRMARANYANSLLAAKKYDEAIAYFNDLVKSEPHHADHFISLGSAYFGRAQSREGDERKADFRLAGEHYARAADLKPGDADLGFNAGLGYLYAGVWDKAEVRLRKAIQQRPDDDGALASLGTALAEQRKFAEALQVIHAAINLKPRNKDLHRQMGGVYSRAGNNAKANEAAMVYLALQNGQPAADPAAAAKAAPEGTAAAKTLASDGVPDQVLTWSADKDTFDTWFYWSQKRAYTFRRGVLVTRSDWSAVQTSVPSAGKK